MEGKRGVALKEEKKKPGDLQNRKFSLGGRRGKKSWGIRE